MGKHTCLMLSYFVRSNCYVFVFTGSDLLDFSESNSTRSLFWQLLSYFIGTCGWVCAISNVLHPKKRVLKIRHCHNGDRGWGQEANGEPDAQEGRVLYNIRCKGPLENLPCVGRCLVGSGIWVMRYRSPQADLLVWWQPCRSAKDMCVMGSSLTRSCEISPHILLKASYSSTQHLFKPYNVSIEVDTLRQADS